MTKWVKTTTTMSVRTTTIMDNLWLTWNLPKFDDLLIKKKDNHHSSLGTVWLRYDAVWTAAFRQWKAFWSLLKLANILSVLSGIRHYYVRLWLHKQAGLLAKDFGGYQPLLGLLGKIDYTEWSINQRLVLTHPLVGPASVMVPWLLGSAVVMCWSMALFLWNTQRNIPEKKDCDAKTKRVVCAPPSVDMPILTARPWIAVMIVNLISKA